MKNFILFAAIAIALLSSCKKKEFDQIIFPDPLTEGRIVYQVCKSHSVHPNYVDMDTISPDAYTRKITFAYDWEDSAGTTVPLLKDTIVTGDFIFTVVMHPKRERIPGSSDDTPGKYHYRIPIAIGWESVDGNSSFTFVKIIVDGDDTMGGQGACPSLSRPIMFGEYSFPGVNGNGIFDR